MCQCRVCAECGPTVDDHSPCIVKKSPEPEFSLTWKHGWKFRNGYSNFRILSVVKGKDSVGVEYKCSGDGDNVNWTSRGMDGRYGKQASILDVINSPAPVETKFVVIRRRLRDGSLFVDGQLYGSEPAASLSHGVSSTIYKTILVETQDTGCSGMYQQGFGHI